MRDDRTTLSIHFLFCDVCGLFKVLFKISTEIHNMFINYHVEILSFLYVELIMYVKFVEFLD